MLAELEYTIANSPVYVAQSKEHDFIEQLLANPPVEPVEDTSSEVHETNRIPDSRILIIKGGKLFRLDGIPVDNSIEKDSYLGRTEYSAYQKIVGWSNSADYGAEAWFSAPYPPEAPIEERLYPVCKIDLGEIYYSKDGTKILLKRAILLDIEPAEFLSIANEFAVNIGLPTFKSTEDMRLHPAFFNQEKLQILFSIVERYTDQVQMVTQATDLSKKLETYASLNVIYEQRADKNSQSDSSHLSQKAREKHMIGNHSKSCDEKLTAFRAFSVDIAGFFTCPGCNGLIKSGAGITKCPHCNLTKERAALITGVICI